jgi:YceI-like domain
MVLALLAGCRSAPSPTVVPPVVAPPIPGSVLYGVDAATSQVALFVYREGPMAALGHNHAIAVGEITGSVQLHTQPERSRFELHFPVEGLQVDPPALRAAAGDDFSSVVSDGARTGTRNNMLGAKLLDGANFARITLRSERVTIAPAGLLITTRVRVRDREKLIDVPVTWRRDGDVLTASGEFALKQTDLGLTPYSVMLGALRVADEMKVRFSIVARRVAL